MANSAGEDLAFLVHLGGEHFDPKAVADKARRRHAADRKRLAAALGTSLDALAQAEERLWLVQLHAEPDALTVDSLRDAHGLRLSAGLTAITFVEHLSVETARRLRRDPLVRACVPYWSDLKRARSSLASPEEALDRRFKLGLVDSPGASFEQQLRALGFEPIVAPMSRPGGLLLVVRAGAGVDPEHLLLLSDVEWIEAVRGVIPTNASSASVAQGGRASGATPIWDKGLHGEGQILGIWDIDLPDLAHDFFRDPNDATTPRPGASHRKFQAVRPQPLDQPLNGSQSPLDSHATWVCGCAIGDDVNAPGAHANRGGAWAAKAVYTDASPLPLSVRDELQASFALGARVHNMSFGEPLADGTRPAPYTADAADYDDALFRNEYLLVVTGVMNTPPCLDQPFGGAPGTAKNSLTVAGTNDAPFEDQFHTGRPGTADGRRKPDLVAVGESVISSDLTTPTNTAVFSSGCGTSLAAPHVAAAAALVRQYFEEGWYPSGEKKASDRRTPSGALLKAMLLNATVDLPQRPYPSVREGWGRLELAETLHFAGDNILLRVRDIPHAFGLRPIARLPSGQLLDRRHLTGRARTFFLNVPPNARSMKVTLVFNDPPGAVGADDPVVNKLDILAMEPMRDRWEGWTVGYFGNDFTNAKVTRKRFLQAADARFPPDPNELKNNVRQVVVDSPVAGRWGLAVLAYRFDAASTPPEFRRGRRAQGYALVARVDLR